MRDATAPQRSSLARAWHHHVEILLVSFAALLLEISYTRVVSFKLFYYYTYLVIGLALLGMGCGGVIVAVSDRLRRAATDSVLLWSALVGSAAVLVGYLVLALTTIDTLAIWEYDSGTFGNVARLVLLCLALFATFLPVGVFVAMLFARRTEDIGRLYFADLLGAGLACGIVVFILNWEGPPTSIMFAGLVLALVGVLIAARTRSRALPVGGVLAVVLAVCTVAPGILPEQRTDTTKTFNPDATIYSAWSALFRVDVTEAGPDVRLLHHDGLIGAAIHRFDGDLGSLTRFDTDDRLLPFATMQRSPDDVLIIGAAGGNEVLASLYFGAGHIDAVELNPVTYDLVTNEFADYGGRIAENPRVNYVRGEGRSYLARADKQYDMIWYPAPDSYSANAATAGAFVLSESYLYTREAVLESFDHLADDGIIAWHYGEFDYESKPNRTARYVATARDAFAKRGIDDPSRHFLVSTAPVSLGGTTLSTVLIKKTPFTDDEIDRFVAGLEVIEGSELRYAPERDYSPGLLSELITTPSDELDAWYDAQESDVRPITDDGPFFWHFTRFGDVIRDFDDRVDRFDSENAVGERVLILLLVVATAFAAVFLLVPFIAIRGTWSRLPRKGSSALYFASLGLGFIFFEIVLIQRLTLFLGYPTYSLTVTLASLLVFTGVGAYLSGKVSPRRERVVPALLAAVVALTLFFQYGLEHVTDGNIDWPLAARVTLVFVLLAPLGVCLGMFMPLGLGAVSHLTADAREYVAWGWAVNGFSSVIGSVLSTILAMMYGFRGVLFLALLAYLVALAVLHRLLGAADAAARSTAKEPSEVEVAEAAYAG